MKLLKLTSILLFSVILASCQLAKLGGDAKENPPNPAERVKKNLEEGKGFRLNNMINKSGGGTNFEFASSNELWRASLDTIDFIPLASVNYSGGIIITDWYANKNIQNQRLKITVYINSNELKSERIKVKVEIQSFKNNTWSQPLTNKSLATQIEDSILNEARNLKLNLDI